MTNLSLLHPTTGQPDPDWSSINSSRVGMILGEFSKLFVDLPAYDAIQGQFEAMRSLGNASKGRQQRSLTLISPSSTGKSTLAMGYRDRINTTEGGPKKVPVVYVTTGNLATAKDVSTRILRNAGDLSNGTIFYLKERLAWVFKFLGVELLILDEIHHLLSKNKQPEIVNFFKSLLNDGLCPIIFIGTKIAAPIFTDDHEMAQRVVFRSTVTPLTVSAKDLSFYASFLHNADQWLQQEKIFDQSSDFIDDFSLECLFEVSEGHIGWTARLLQSALWYATYRHASRIEFYDLALAVDNWPLKLERTLKNNPFRGEKPKCVR